MYEDDCHTEFTEECMETFEEMCKTEFVTECKQEYEEICNTEYSSSARLNTHRYFKTLEQQHCFSSCIYYTQYILKECTLHPHCEMVEEEACSTT